MTTQVLHTPVLETDRLTLRAPVRADLSAYLAFNDVSDTSVGKYRGQRPQAEVAPILHDDIDHWSRKGFGMFILTLKGTDQIIGGAGIAHPDDWPSHELTWWLMPGARGAGFAAEASRAVLAWAKSSLGWPVVETHFRDENLPARRLAERLGGKFVRRQDFPDNVPRDVFAFETGAFA